MKNLIVIILVLAVLYFGYTMFKKNKVQEVVVEEGKKEIFDQQYAAVLYAKQAEAKLLAQSLQAKQSEYQAVNGVYAKDLKELGFDFRMKQNYSAAIASADNQTFEILITGNIDNDPAIDTWKVTPDKIENILSDAEK